MTWRVNSSYAGRQGNRAGERFMRLRLFDRIRRLAHFRRPPVEATPGTSGAQGRHRRSRRRGPASGPAPAGPSPGGPPAELAHTAAPWAGGSPASQAPFPPVAPADRDPADRDPADRDPADRDPADRDRAARAPGGPAAADQDPAGRAPAERTGAGPGPTPGPRRGAGP